jgi:hypothetical protein
MNEESRLVEAERQRRLIERLLAARADPLALSTRETGDRALRGLQAYRANADASAERALATAYPTVKLLLGDEDFQNLARDFWRAAPPLHGDLGEWGAGLAAWIATHEQLIAWPYLTDCARLDWALHCCERADDTSLEADTLARLGDTDPWRLAIEFTGGLGVIESAWPIASIHEANATQDDALFEKAREAIEQQRGEAVIVSRRGFKAVATRIDARTAHWMRQLVDGSDLAAALADAGDGFDFAAWLAMSVQSGWLKGIRVLRD